jgi:hypothetical protein
MEKILHLHNNKAPCKKKYLTSFATNYIIVGANVEIFKEFFLIYKKEPY